MNDVKIDLSNAEAQRQTYLAALRCGRIKEVIRVAEAFAAANLTGSADALKSVARNMTGAGVGGMRAQPSQSQAQERKPKRS